MRDIVACNILIIHVNLLLRTYRDPRAVAVSVMNLH